MEPVYDVTRQQSEENFRNHSFLTKTEVMYALDAWIDRVKRNQYDIQISETGKNALKKALFKLRESLLAKDMPALEVYGRRYALDIFDDRIQCGYEVFGDHELFDDNGYLVPWALTEEEAKEYEEKGDNEDDPTKPEFYIVSCIPIQLMSIEEWAKDNGVKVATARQWAARDRIHTHKVGRNLMVSPIQYTPAAFAASKDTNSRFVGHVKTESIKDKYPFLFDELMDISIIPSSEKNVFMVGRNGNDAVTAIVTVMNIEDRLSLTEDLLKLGLKEYNHLRSPIGKADFDLSYRFARISTPKRKEAEDILPKDLEVSVSVTGKPAIGLKPEPENIMAGGDSPEISINITGNDMELNLSGYLMNRYQTAEVKLLKNIFGEHPVDAVVSGILEKAGVKEGRCYSWDETVLFLTGITVKKGTVTKEMLAFILRSMSRLVKDGIAARPTSIVLHFSTKEGPTAVNKPEDAFLAEDAAKLAGFAIVRKGKGAVDFHAYISTESVLRPKKQKDAE